MRNPECKNYNECLGIAADNHDTGFGCDGCDGKTIFKPVQKKNLNRVYVDFTQYPKLYLALINESKKQVRSMSRQVVFWCRKAREDEEKDNEI